MADNDVLEHIKHTATPLRLAAYLTPKIWGDDAPFRVDPWMTLSEERIMDAFIDEQRRFLKINAPPQVTKSTLVEIWTPLWILGHWPNTRIGLICYSDDLAQDSGALVRDIIKNWGMELFGIDIDPAYDSKKTWRLAGHRGGMHSVGIGSTVTGKPMDVVVIGDVIKNMEEAGSKATKDKHWGEMSGAIRARQAKLYLLAATRFADDDLSGRIDARQANPDYKGEMWETLAFKAIAEPALNEDDTPEWRDMLGRKKGEPLLCRFSAPDEEKEENWETSHFYITRASEEDQFVWCTPAETPIVMADRTSRPISEIEVGDEVLGFTLRASDGRRSKLCASTVLAVNRLRAPVNTMTMESGATVRCTAEHKWFTGRCSDHISGYNKDGSPRHREEYLPAKIGRSLKRMDPALPALTSERQRDLDWIAGIIDGEGHIADSSLVIAQSRKANSAVCDAIDACLRRLGWGFNHRTKGHYVDSRGIPNTGAEVWVVRQPRPVYTELLRRTNIAKREQVLDALERRPRMPVLASDRVLQIAEGGPEDVWALQTTTGNYIAWGYASSNSAVYQQEPTSPTGGMFPPVNWAWYDPDDIPPLVATRRAWDLAASEGAGDWSVGTRVARTWAGDYLVLDVLRDRKSGANVKQWVEETALADGPPTRILIERERSGSGKALHEFYQRALPLFDVQPAIPDGSKEERARTASILQQSGRLKLPKRADGTMPKWVPGYIEELRKMMGDGRRGRHDDQIDTTAYAVNDMISVATTIVAQNDHRFSGSRGLIAVGEPS